MQGTDAVGANTDDTDGNLKLLFEKLEVGDEVRGELGGVSDVGEVGIPAGQGYVLRGDGGEFARVG